MRWPSQGCAGDQVIEEEEVDSGPPLVARRTFLAITGAAAALAPTHLKEVVAAGIALDADPQPHDAAPQDEGGTPSSAPEITETTIREAEKLAGIEYTRAERKMIVESGIGEDRALFAARRSLPLSNDDAPGQSFRVSLTAARIPTEPLMRPRNLDEPPPLPDTDEDIAFAPTTHHAWWISQRQLTSTRLTQIYLDRLKEYGPRLECVVTLMEDSALAQAQRADAEIDAGKYRGPLHGIPWGAKDLLDTRGIATTWGAEPFVSRVPDRDAVVVTRLEEAGAVLVAKLTLGALAYGDIWYGGKTKNPFDPSRGSSGSSAGSASATAAGLVSFAIGTETYGSIVSPCMECGTTGLRPTFGRVARTGAMALCWSLDKIGPITRTVEDAVIVLDAINGGDPGDASSLSLPLAYDGNEGCAGLRVGYDPAWFEPGKAHDLDAAMIDHLRVIGAEPVPMSLPDLPYGSLIVILLAEAASAFEELTISNQDDLLRWQEPEAWPNTFRRARFIPAIEYVQAERLRRRVMGAMDEIFLAVDALIAPSYGANLLLITNMTGHPSLIIRNGMTDRGRPHGITLIGAPFDEGRLTCIGRALEQRLDVWRERPDLTKV